MSRLQQQWGAVTSEIRVQKDWLPSCSLSFVLICCGRKLAAMLWAALRRDPCGKELLPPANSKEECEAFQQPRQEFGSVSSSSWALRWDHRHSRYLDCCFVRDPEPEDPAKPYLDSWPTIYIYYLKTTNFRVTYYIATDNQYMVTISNLPELGTAVPFGSYTFSLVCACAARSWSLRPGSILWSNAPFTQS